MSENKKSKTFKDIIEKFNPYHDRLGRFTSGGGFGIAGSFYTGDRDRQAVTFSANPETKAGRLAIERHGGTMTAAYDDKPVEPTGPGTKKLSLDQEAIKRADDNSLMGTAGTSRAKEAHRRVDEFKEEFKEKSDWTDEQKAYVKQRQDEYTDLVSEYYNDQIRRTADNVSWAVAGPANYNYARHDKKMNAQMNRANEYEEKLARFKENTTKKLESMTPEDQQIARWRNGKWKNGETIDAADPLAEKKMQAKLDYLNESQQKMKDANAYYRRNKTMSGFEGFSESTNQRIDSAMKDARMTKPFASYQLTNNNAQIKATQSRLTQLQSNKAKAAANGGAAASTSFKGGSVIRNTEANRLQIKFDDIPDASTRQQLKSNGWRWSPKNGVWQRQLTDNAERSAARLLEGFGKSRTPPDDGEKAIFIGLNVSGADELAMQGGEDPKDFHVTLLYGYYKPRSDIEDTVCRVQKAIEAIRPMIPDELHLDKIDTFEQSESSDNKKVVIARVAAGQLEKVHAEFRKQLKDNGLDTHDSFSEYRPHMTLAYVDPEADVSVREISTTVKITNLTIGIEDEEGSTQDNAYQVNKSDSERTFEITKAEEDKRLVFGWANVATRANGEVIQDWQNDIVEPEDLEEAVYEYVLNFRDGGEEHVPDLRKKARMVESVVFTEEKLKAMGIPVGTVPLGWWIGFYVDDDEAWKKIKDGTYKMFSVEGQGQRVPTEDLDTRMKKSFEAGPEDPEDWPKKPVAKTFSELMKFNPYHDARGRFTGPGGYASFSANPQTKAGKLAIKREQKNNPLIGAAYGTMKTEGQKKQARRDRQSQRMAQRIMQEYGITGSTAKQATADITELYRDIDKNGTLKLKDDGKPSIKRAAYDKIVDISRKTAAGAEYTDNSTKAEYDEIRSYVKKNPVNISAQDKSNIADFESYKRNNFGNMTISNKGISVDSFYQQLSEMYPQHFDGAKYTNPGDQITHINDVISGLKPKTVRLTRAEQEEVSKEMTKYIIGGYFVKNELKIAKSFSDIMKFNPYHDRLGRFTSAGAGASFSANPNTKAGKLAIERASKDNPLIGVAYAPEKPTHNSAATGKSYEMPKLESKEAEQDRQAALERLERHFSFYPNRNNKLIDEKMPAYLEETDPKEWSKRAHATPMTAVHHLINAKTKAQKEQEAANKKDREARSRAMDRAAMKRTKAFERYRDYENSLREKYTKDSWNKMGWHGKVTAQEAQKLDELRAATVFRNKRGQWQIAKTFSEIIKIAK